MKNLKLRSIQVKEVASIEADAPVEAAEGKTSEEPVASTEDKVNSLQHSFAFSKSLMGIMPIPNFHLNLVDN